MGRLERGENQTIDLINDLVYNVKHTSGDTYQDSFTTLLDMFKPLILSLCNKWANYFNDTSHTLKRWDELVADAEYWFMKYTIEKYTIDGSATFNNFIKKHLDQRIRYIYETELRYYSKLIFPDPSKDDELHDTNVLERVIHQYSSQVDVNVHSDDIINDDICMARIKVANRICELVNNSHLYTDKEKKIFNDVMVNGKTHNSVGEELNVSRTRISQILKKIKTKLYNQMNNDEVLFDLIYEADIEFKEQ